MAKHKFTAGKMVKILKGKCMADWFSPLQRDPLLGQVCNEPTAEVKIERS